MLNLMHINEQFRSDMGFVIDSWSPIHVVAHPEDIPQIQEQFIMLHERRHSPKIERICLDVFHSSETSQMMTTGGWLGQHYFCKPGYWRSWEEAIPKLPPSAKEIWFDLTPAPADMRNRHGLTINPFVHDKRTQQFLEAHSSEVARLIWLVNKRYSGCITIRATGRLSERSTFFITALQIESGIPVEFDGVWVSGEDTVFADINLLARQIARTGVGRKAERRGAPNRLAWLRNVKWSRQTSWTYAKVAHAGEMEAAVQDLRNLVDFAKEEGEENLEMDAVDSVRRALQHRMAEDLGLKTVSEGVELRNRIYELVATDDEPVQVVRRFDDGDNSDMKSKDQDFRSNYAGLTRVCRHIRDEYLPIHRQYARISLNYDDLEQWMKLLGEHPPVKELEVRISAFQNCHSSRARIDWLPLLRARASSRSSESDQFRVTVHFTTPEPEFPMLHPAFYYAHWGAGKDMVDYLQQLIDVQNTCWLELLCNDPCPLENVFLCVSEGTVRFAFKKTQNSIDLEDKDAVHNFCDDLGFGCGYVLFREGRSKPEYGWFETDHSCVVFDGRDNPTLEAYYLPAI
ncbi:hypothetical protein SLS60_009840 [Paraconiothyrium brasiliense]|uniref:R3H domain-containing protein n=1 Tax=Paraconiothyrium brasiliense TaxID=300254 RepID=A0ABR3QTQ0_9PLEO